LTLISAPRAIVSKHRRVQGLNTSIGVLCIPVFMSHHFIRMTRAANRNTRR